MTYLPRIRDDVTLSSHGRSAIDELRRHGLDVLEQLAAQSLTLEVRGDHDAADVPRGVLEAGARPIAA